jgi:flagellar motor switch protein FliG
MNLLNAPNANRAGSPATSGGPATASADHTSLTGAQKAAILLVTVGEEASSHIVRLLGEDELKTVSSTIAELPLITPEQAESVLEEFYQATVARNYPHRGGAGFARRILVSAFGRDGSRQLLADLRLEEPENDRSLALRETNPQQLAKLIAHEHPQTIAILLSHLGNGQAGRLLSALDRDLRAKVVTRIATLDSVSTEVVRKVITVVADRMKSLGKIESDGPIGGTRAAAELLNTVNPDISDQILIDVGEKREPLAQAIRNAMFVFDDLTSIDAKGVRELVAKADRKVLSVALKGTSEELKKHILGSMSQRGAEMIREDIDAMGPVKIKDVEIAQQQIISLVRALQTQGVLSVGGSGDDQYVV